MHLILLILHRATTQTAYSSSSLLEASRLRRLDSSSSVSSNSCRSSTLKEWITKREKKSLRFSAMNQSLLRWHSRAARMDLWPSVEDTNSTNWPYTPFLIRQIRDRIHDTASSPWKSYKHQTPAGQNTEPLMQQRLHDQKAATCFTHVWHAVQLPVSDCLKERLYLKAATCALPVGIYCAWLWCIALITRISASPVAVATARACPVFWSKQACRSLLRIIGCELHLSCQLTKQEQAHLCLISSESYDLAPRNRRMSSKEVGCKQTRQALAYCWALPLSNIHD